MVPFVQWPQQLDVSASYTRLLEILPFCRDMPELYVKYHKAMAHLCIQPVKINWRHLGYTFLNAEFGQTRIRLIRDAFMAGRDAYKQLNLKDTREADAQQNLRADIRTALRTVVVHRHANRLSRPDDEDLIWHGDWRWHRSHEHEPSCEDFDWLVDYLADNNTICSPADFMAGDAHTDDETKGDALLALSAMQGLGSPTKRQTYISSLIRCMGPARSPRVRHSALRAVFEAREELASIASASTQQDLDVRLLDQLSRALLTVVRPNGVLDSGRAAHHREFCYIHIIYTLIKNDEWRQRLTGTNDVHLARRIYLVDGS
ncbi:hypothetical protein BDR07DRAFT_1490103 [Suillus spraguei]|nr:hypothetical protein BDR07DRAFT_1490103 [Suillus spraguei]